jgi:hypothetical protein
VRVKVQHNKDFGKYVLNPSQMTQVLKTGLEQTLQLYAGMRGPMYERATGKLLGLSVDADGPISEETFDKEVQDICKAHDAKIDAIQALVNECNAGMRQLAAQNGTTAQKLYWNINLYALLEDIPALRGKDAEIAAEFVRRLKQAAPAQGHVKGSHSKGWQLGMYEVR